MTAPGGFPSADNFHPNEICLRELQAMGFDQETAAQGSHVSRIPEEIKLENQLFLSLKALFFSGNNSSDAAVTWIFDNQGQSPQVASAFGGAADVGGWGGNVVGLGGEEEYTMVIIINASLGMSPGKIAAQAAHGAVGAYRQCLENQQRFGAFLHRWEIDGERTIVLGGDNAPHLEALERRALDRGLVACLTSDAGRTQVAQGAKTALCIFGEKAKVDAITGNLKTL